MSITPNDVLLAPKYFKILMDRGASVSIICNDLARINKFNTKQTSENKWSMMARSFLMSCEAEGGIKLPELNTAAHIFAPFHVTDQKSNYNATFDRDLLREIQEQAQISKITSWVGMNPRYP